MSFRIACRAFGPRPGLIAAGITAVYFYFNLYAVSLMFETFYIVSILWTVEIAMRLADLLAFRSPSMSLRGIRLGLELGIAMTGSLLLRQVVLVFLVVLVVRLLWLAQAGWELWYVPTAAVIHFGEASSRQLAETMYLQLYRTKIQFYRKFGGASRARRLKELVGLGYAPRTVIATVRGQLDAAWRPRAHTYRRLLAELPRL